MGVTELHEEIRLTQDQREFDSMVKSYEAVTLEGDSVRASIMSALSGRVISLVDKQTGREMLRRAGPEERNYPDQGGALLEMYQDSEGASPRKVSWRLASTGRDSVVLAGDSEDGMRLERHFRFEGRRLCARTTVHNQGSQTREFVLAARAEFGGPDVRLRFCRDGVELEKQVLPADEHGAGEEAYAGGELRIADGSSGELLVEGFTAGLAERSVVTWLGRGQDTVTMSTWAKRQRLAPGGSMQFDTVLSVHRAP